MNRLSARLGWPPCECQRDPIVLWPLVRRGPEEQLPALRESKIVRTADQNVRCNVPGEASRQLLSWIQG